MDATLKIFVELRKLKMIDLLRQAEQRLLAPAGLSISKVQPVLEGMLTHAVDYADFYFQHSRQEGWVLEDSLIKDGSYHIDHGVGVRAVNGEKTGFAYADEIVLPALHRTSTAAKSIAKQSTKSIGISEWNKIDAATLYGDADPLQAIPEEDKVALLQFIDQQARKADSRICQVQASLAGVHETVLIMATDGTLSADVRPLVRCNVSVIAEENGKRERGTGGGGGRFHYAYFFESNKSVVQGYVDEAVRLALLGLEAQAAPAGNMPIVLGPGWPGVLLHEAVGHGLEGDFNRKGSSVYSGMMGEKVASSLCTVVDDGTLQERRGSLSVDDEGTPTACTTLIESGILVGYMQDKLNARLMGQKPTGNGRRESYAHLPMPRMTNTYMLAGDSRQEEMIGSIDRGIYAANLGGGQVDITSGKFVFSTSEAYLVENGKIMHPVKGATLIGNGFDAMNSISMVGNDLALDSGVGVCGKDGQSVPVGVGQPSMKLDEITVGGTGI